MTLLHNYFISYWHEHDNKRRQRFAFRHRIDNFFHLINKKQKFSICCRVFERFCFRCVEENLLHTDSMGISTASYQWGTVLHRYPWVFFHVFQQAMRKFWDFDHLMLTLPIRKTSYRKSKQTKWFSFIVVSICLTSRGFIFIYQDYSPASSERKINLAKKK